MAARNLWMHGLLFGVASVLAYRSWSAEEAPHSKHVGAELWSGRAQALSKVEFSTSKKQLVLEPQKDQVGQFYIATVQSLVSKSKDAKAKSSPHSVDPHSVDPHSAKPHGSEPHGSSAAGAGGAGMMDTAAAGAGNLPHDGAGGAGQAAAAPDSVEAAEAKVPEPLPSPKRFISVERGQQLVDALATLRAHRVLGKVEGERLAEFGFDKSEAGVLKVTLQGQVHELVFGDKTPGGKDRYVRDPVTELGYVIAGKVANDLTGSENRLVERQFHDFADGRAIQVKLSNAGAGREIRRHPTEKNSWASVDDPDTKDETLSNWMTKLERLRVTHYVEKPSPTPTQANAVVRVEYADAEGKSLGFLEVIRLPPEEGKTKTRYLARSDRSRWFATILRSTAEQLDQDLASVLSK